MLLTDRPLWLCHVDSPLLETALLRRTQIKPAALRQPRIWGPQFGNQHWIVDLSRVSNKATG